MADPDTIEYTPFTEHRVRTGDTLENIAQKNGITWQELSFFNFGTAVPDEVNRCLHDFTGATKRTQDGKNYLFSDEDVPGIIYVPKIPQPFTLDTGAYHKIRVKRPILFSRVEVQTVDEFGHRVKNADLILRPENGLPDVSIKSDATGYGKLDKVRAGKYAVLLASGDPAWMFDPTKSSTGGDDDDDDKLVEAHLETNNHLRAITRIVVARTASEEWRKQTRVLERIHGRTGEATAIQGRGQETTGKTRESLLVASDNLALAAGWIDDRDLNEKELVATVLKGFLRDYQPTPSARGYHVLVLSPTTRTIRLVNSEGNVEKEFKLAAGLTPKALFGAYAVFENVSGTLFVDMATMSYPVVLPQKPEGINVDEIVTDPAGLRDAIKNHGRQVEILYFAPNGGQLVALAMMGGTGRLEDYGTDKEVNDSIHKRNLAVCTNIARAYNAYLDNYIEKVKKTKNDSELRPLGPPRTPYEMPAPAGATDDQIVDIFKALNTHELKAWVAIAHQLDRFANRLSQGYPFLRIKPKFVVKPQAIDKIRNLLRTDLPSVSGAVADEVEVEVNIDLQLVDGQFEVVTKGDVAIKVKLKLDEEVKKLTKRGVPVEISFKQNIGNSEKRTVSVKIGGYTIEKDTVGKTKLSVKAPFVTADAEMNTRTGMFGGGVTLKFSELAENMKGKGRLADKLAGYIKGFELQIQLGFLGITEETVLAATAINHGPGYFGRRSLDELFDPNTHWVDLTTDEHAALAELGWHGAVWDGKYHKEYKDKLPESVGKLRSELSAAERLALVKLGFHAYEDYRHHFKKKTIDFADYTY